MKINSYGGLVYFLLIVVNDFPRMTFVCFLTSKSEVIAYSKIVLMEEDPFSDVKVECVRYDNAHIMVIYAFCLVNLQNPSLT